mmetsp:Transcript_26815/g.63950  ORF Transcript_26815/g.63950 Transcript_26815/m.63950 type:complete len:83 (-) Transcript_26815:4447-4695(-)
MLRIVPAAYAYVDYSNCTGKMLVVAKSYTFQLHSTIHQKIVGFGDFLKFEFFAAFIGVVYASKLSIMGLDLNVRGRRGKAES